MKSINALLILALLFSTTAYASSPPLASSSKLSPWVMGHTADGQTAEFLVVLNAQADLSGAAALPTKLQKGRYVFQQLQETAQATQAELRAWLAARQAEYHPFYIVNAVWVKGDRALALELAARPEVARVVGNPLIVNSIEQPETLQRPNAPLTVETGITYIHAPEVWAQGFTGQGIVIGGQDTGYQWDHPALKSHYRGWDGITTTHDYNWHDSIHVPNFKCPADSPAPCDDYGHGTHTMGTAVGDDGAGNQIGVAPGARWISCRNMNDGTGSPATYLECFEFFLAPYALNASPAQGDSALAPDVTINSWGCPPEEGCDVDSLRAAVEAQRAAGIMTVVAAGNTGSQGCQSITDPPAIYDAAYTIGALDTNADTLASFSSRGAVSRDGSGRLKPDLTAPGTGVRSSYPMNAYQSMMGTSMATPHVVGAIALLWSARAALRNQIDLTEQILNTSAVHLPSSSCGSNGSWPNNVYGYGRLDISAAVNLISSGSGTLTGTVSNAVTALPVPGLMMTATFRYTPTLQIQLVPDAAGVFTQTLPPGVYTLTTTAPGFFSLTLGEVMITDALSTPLNLALKLEQLLHLPLVIK